MKGTYFVTAKHDKGIVTLPIEADSFDDAAKKFCDRELAPLSAIRGITFKRVKNA